MKLIFTVALLLTNITFILGQERIYFDSSWKETEKETAKYYRITKKEDSLFLIKDYFMSGKLQFEGHSSKDREPLRLEGQATWYNEEGVIIQKATLHHNKRNGKYFEYYSNGDKKVEGNFIDELAYGTYIEYYPNNQVGNIANFEADKMNGTYIKYRPDGKLWRKVNYKHGIEDGPYEYYDYYNGILLDKGNALNGVQDGMCYNYNGDKVWKQYFIKNGKLDGFYYEFSKNGDTVTTGQFKDGIALQFKSVRSANGSKFSSVMQLAGAVEQWKVFRDSNLIVESFYQNGAKTGKWSIYTFDGKKLFQTKDYTKANCNDEAYLQKTGEKFNPDFFLSDRFYYKDNILTDGDECENVVVQTNEVIRDEHPFYHLNYPGRRANSFIKVDSIDYKEPADKKEFLQKNNCQEGYDTCSDVTVCTRVFGKLTYKVFLSENLADLKKIKQALIPADNEILFFYQKLKEQKYNRSAMPNDRAMGFSLPNAMKEAIKEKRMDEAEIIRVIEHEFFNVSDFSGLTAYYSLEGEIEQ